MDTSTTPKVYNETIGQAQPKEAQANPEVIRWQIETLELMDNLRLLLLNSHYVQNLETGVFRLEKNQYGKALINEDGVQEVLTIIRPHLDKNMILSNLTDSEIAYTMVELRSKLCLLFQRKYVEWAVEKAKLPIIICLVLNPVWSALKRASNETTLSYLGKTHQLTEIRRADDSNNKSSFAENFLRPTNRNKQ